jgi:hypothetical protein
MVKVNDDDAVRYVNYKTGFHSLRIGKGVDPVISICDTDMEEGHWEPTVECTIYSQDLSMDTN